MKQEKILAWHFIQDDGRTAYGNMLVEAGKTYSTDETPVLCKAGFHASERLLDALKYAPGGVVCRVELWGEVKYGSDKLVAQNRHVQWMLDVTRLLDKFACEVAEETLRKHGVTDERSWNAIKVKREWVDGKATNEELEAACSAAWAAAWDAAGNAACSAARAAAWAAAREAAWAAAREAARAAAWADLNARLEAQVLQLAGSVGYQS